MHVVDVLPQIILFVKTNSSLIEGCWRLIFFLFVWDGRTFVGVDLFSAFQEVYLRTDDPRVSNIEKFSDFVGELKVKVFQKFNNIEDLKYQYILEFIGLRPQSQWNNAF